MKAWAPIINDDGKVTLRNARHPLIDPTKVVPISLHLGHDFDTMIITGPNTGGKTVSLKTVGLLTLMGQAGLHIPAFDRSKLALFDEVFADIEKDLPKEIIAQHYNEVMRNAYMGNKLEGIVPHIGIFEFFEELKKDQPQD